MRGELDASMWRPPRDRPVEDRGKGEDDTEYREIELLFDQLTEALTPEGPFTTVKIDGDDYILIVYPFGE